MSRSGYYAWLHRSEPGSVESDRQLLKLITNIYERSHGRYGSPRIFHALRQMGVRTSEKRVARLMRESGLKARVTRVTRRQPGLKRFQSKGKNLLLERGGATGIDQIWVADVTYIKLAGKWTYLATIMDQYSRRILGWSLAYTRTTGLTTAALKYAIKKDRNSESVILHTDRGVEFTGAEFQNLLKENGMHHSVNRLGCCTDNAYMESFYHSLKGELIRKRTFGSFKQLHRELGQYINQFYNSVRLHSGLGYTSPIQYEQMAA